MRKRRTKVKSKLNKKTRIALISLGSLLSIYLGISLFFVNHFTFGTKIDGIDVAGNNVKEVESKFENKIKDYSLTLNERNGNSETIKADDIGLKYASSGEIKKILKEQSAFSWIIGIFKDRDYENLDELSYDKDMFLSTLSNLNCVKGEDIEAPKSAYLKFKNSRYVIVPEEKGNTVNKEILTKEVSKAVLNGSTSIDIDKKGCYEKPKYTANNKKVKECLQTLNKYMLSEITYKKGQKSITCDKNTTNKWIDIDDDFNISVNEYKVSSFVDKVAGVFNTYQDTRDFKTSNGNVIKVAGGDYGWILDKTSTKSEIQKALLEGKKVTLEPKFSQEAASESGNDYGNSYIEISFVQQHLWLYKEGKMIFETDIVSGSIANNCATPPGTYYIKYREKNATLKGEGYQTHVSFWMPFNGNIGLHDSSTWRSEWGGNIYVNGGSHGCINLSYEAAEKIFNSIKAGYPVICYYDSSLPGYVEPKFENQ